MLWPEEKMELICEKWAPLAQEYAKFLNRHGLPTVSVITKRNELGYVMSVYSLEEKYLEISLNNTKFIEEEKQLNTLLQVIEALAIRLFLEEEEDDEDTDEEYYDVDCMEDTDDWSNM